LSTCQFFHINRQLLHGGSGNNMHETLLDQLSFKQSDHYNLPRVKQFYKLNGMRAQAPRGDLIYTATLDTRILAALRLHPINNSEYLLRSMCVHADYRRFGIGRALLQFLQPQLNSIDCYCFPYSHLNDFYSSAGFYLLDSHLAPQIIFDKFSRYRNNGKDICLMKHQRQSVLK